MKKTLLPLVTLAGMTLSAVAGDSEDALRKQFADLLINIGFASGASASGGSAEGRMQSGRRRRKTRTRRPIRDGVEERSGRRAPQRSQSGRAGCAAEGAASRRRIVRASIRGNERERRASDCSEKCT